MDDKNAGKFAQAVDFLHPRIAEALLRLDAAQQRDAREIRLRAGRPVQVVSAQGACPVAHGALMVTQKELQDSFARLCAYSVHSHTEGIARGFVTTQGGHRAGLCGTAVVEGGLVVGLRELSSINLRIAGEYPGCARGLFQRFFAQGLCSLLIAGAPGSGKTTLLRDLARWLSADGTRVVVLDERGEIAAAYRGVPQNDIGAADVLTGYPKGAGLQIALRSLNPQVILCDEIGDGAEVAALQEGLHAGVHCIATAHAADAEDLRRRPQLRTLQSSGAFDHTVLLRGVGGGFAEVPRAPQGRILTADAAQEGCVA
ncbi:MAG: Flp pilus assembly complex ATPase component TadA [Oscillospiraceae bacterium]|jgi:stage III sporulation protein AA|nr:Flp pilus assembly complex ATPase component TadA [Oscillospiraceae bacterium]